MNNNIQDSILNTINDLKNNIIKIKIETSFSEENFIDSINSTFENIISFEEILVKTKYINYIHINHINEAISFGIESLENKDWMLVCDIMEYEILRILNIWESEIQKIGE